MPRLCLYLFMGIFLFACDDIIEKDISDASVSLVAPGNNSELNIGEIPFLWDKVAGACQYKLQVVTPDFKDIKTILVDTIVKKEKLTLKFPNGTYQWRLKAQNSYYESDYSYQSFQVDTTGINKKE